MRKVGSLNLGKRQAESLAEGAASEPAAIAAVTVRESSAGDNGSAAGGIRICIQ